MFRVIAAFFCSVVLSWGSAMATSVDDIDIHWISEGEGPTVIFVHGGFVDMSTWMWGDQFSELAKDFRVVALDLPGHGQSGWPSDGQLSMELAARAVDAVRAATGADKVVLVGHSMGGNVLRRYWLTYPDHVAGLVTVDAPWDPRVLAVQVPYPPQCSSLETGRFECWIRETFFLPDTPPNVRDWVVNNMLPRLGEIRYPGRTDVYQTETVVTVPILEVYGADRVSLGIDLDALSESPSPILPMAKYETIPGTGHLLNMERPEEFYQILREFLQDVEF